MAAAGTRKKTIWDLALLVLGLNVWVNFLLLPALHLGRHGALLPLTALPLLALLAGVALRRRSLLLGGFPLLLLLPVLAAPDLVGVNVYSPLTFGLVALSHVVYLVAALVLLGTLEAPEVPAVARPLSQTRRSGPWSRRLRFHRQLAALAGLFAITLIFVAFLHPGVQQDLRDFYPRREGSAGIMLGVVALALWLAVFYAYFAVPLRLHIRSDPPLRHQLQRLRSPGARGRPRPLFYAFVALALVGMGLLVLLRGCG
jgi:hypothetical protein